ncbi:MAG: hypothetical protein ACRCWF_01050 [Beijerinckiaceae bacterium]
MNLRNIATLNGIAIGVVLAGLVGCQQGFQSIDLALSTAANDGWSEASEYKTSFAFTMATIVVLGGLTSAIVMTFFLPQDWDKE